MFQKQIQKMKIEIEHWARPAKFYLTEFQKQIQKMKIEIAYIQNYICLCH